MQLYLIRHAQPDYANDTITAQGHEQAKLLSEYLKDIKIDKLYASPMGRARNTAAYTAECKGMTPVIEDWAAELDGQYEKGEFSWSQPAVENLKGETVPSLSDWQDMVPYGRHMEGVINKLRSDFNAFISRFGYHAEKNRYKVDDKVDNYRTAALFCHEGFIKTLLGCILNWPLPLIYSHTTISHASTTLVRFEEDQGYCVPRLQYLNLNTYLKDKATDN